MNRSVLLAIALLVPACAARTTIEPLGRGTTAYNVSLGGPMVAAFDTWLPIPNLSVGVNHGYCDDLDIGGTVYLLPLLYGNVGLDVGATWYPLVDTAGTTIALQPRIMAFASFREGVDSRFRAWPVVSASAAWRAGRDRIYTGFDMLVFASSFMYDEEAPPLILSPFVGYRWAIGESGRLMAELKWHGVNVRTNATVEYVNPFGQGGLAPFVGYELEW
ncbi:MAG TPA: hypothetical protein VNA88_09745 [Candidatus Kapabacteria bacterium]|jgi:hypothetical protein|nr:hypothetical protein [Candidatus Kapabacteria bacterium]